MVGDPEPPEPYIPPVNPGDLDPDAVAETDEDEGIFEEDEEEEEEEEDETEADEAAEQEAHEKHE
jgi:hypothetical protein